MRRHVYSLLVAAVGLVVALGPSRAESFERTQTCDPTGAFKCDSDETPRPISWPVRCVRYRINDAGSSDFGNGEKLGDALENLVVESFDAWQNQSCTDLHLVEGERTSNQAARYREDAGYSNNMNLVVWRDDDWPYPGSKYAFALTSVTYTSSDGTITDADLEINTSQYDFADLSGDRTNDRSPPVDMRNTLTHEVGHFIGLAHPDDEPEATMHGRAKRGEIKKRSLHEDDIAGLCEIYPKQDPPASCSTRRDFVPPRARDDRGGDDGLGGCTCSTGSAPSEGESLAFLFLVALFVASRRRWIAGDGES